MALDAAISSISGQVSHVSCSIVAKSGFSVVGSVADGASITFKTSSV
jgi:hypothetical protein